MLSIVSILNLCIVTSLIIISQIGKTPLACASGNGHVEAVHLLLDKGALINEVTVQ